MVKRKRKSVKKRKSAYARANQRIAGYLNYELKYWDTRVDNSFSAANVIERVDPAPNCLFSPGEGVGPQSRDGRIAVLRSIEISGRIFFGGALEAVVPTVWPNEYVRIMLVHDKQTNAAVPTAPQIWTDPAGTVYDDLQFVNLENASRFTVISNHLHTSKQQIFPSGNLEESSMRAPEFRHFTMKYTLPRPLAVHFQGNSGNVESIRDHSFHIFALGSSTASRITYQCRCRFTG